jgi:hypothetical protein
MFVFLCWVLDPIRSQVTCVPSGDYETWVPGSPPTRLTAVPDKLVRPTRRLSHLVVDSTDLVGSPHDLLKTFQKIPQMT